MLRAQPVSEANADPPYALHATDARRQLRTQESGVSGLVRQTPHGGQTQIDRRGRVAALLKVETKTVWAVDGIASTRRMALTAGGSGCSGVSVGRSSLSNRANMESVASWRLASMVSPVIPRLQGGVFGPAAPPQRHNARLIHTASS